MEAGDRKTILLRKMPTETTFPSPFLEVSYTKTELLTNTHLKFLTYSLSDAGILTIDNLTEVFQHKHGNGITYKVGQMLPPVQIPISKNPNRIEIPVKENDVVKVYADQENASYTLDISKEEMPNQDIIVKSGDQAIKGFGVEKLFGYKKEGEAIFAIADKDEITDLPYGRYEIRKLIKDKTYTFKDAGGSTAYTLSFDSDPIFVDLSAPAVTPNYYYPLILEMQAEAERKAEEERAKAEEAKKAEQEKTKAEAEKKTEKEEEVTPTLEETNKEKTQSAEVVKKSIKQRKKAKVSVSSKVVSEILQAKKGSLDVSLKGMNLHFPKTVLENVLGEEAKTIGVSVKTASVKKTFKIPSDKKIPSKKTYSVFVKVGKESINQFDLKESKFLVSFKVKMKKAPKKLYVLNLKTGELTKASYKKGNLTFQTKKVGTFVIVERIDL